jgi:hypothetical protein
MEEYNKENKEESKENFENNIDNEIRNNNFSSLSKGHKFAVFGLILFSIFFVYMWSVQFKNSLKNPLSVNLNNNINNNKEAFDKEDFDCPGGECGGALLLKDKDTDGDGISDYDELYIHNTSPYLEDTDGDGISDKDEIENRTDPNCPEGRECYVSETENILDDNQKNNIKTGNSLEENPPFSLEGGVEEGNKNYENILKGEGDADTIRNMLIEAGMDKSILDQINDEDLLRSYRETLGL